MVNAKPIREYVYAFTAMALELEVKKFRNTSQSKCCDDQKTRDSKWPSIAQAEGEQVG